MTHTRTTVQAVGSIGVFLAPVLVFAQAQGQPIDKLGLFLQQFIGFIDNYLVPLLFAIAFIVFIFGIFRYFILGGADEEKRSQGRTLMLWGMIGFFVMVSIWGILNLFVHSLGFGADSRPDLPTFGKSSSAPSQSAGATLPAAAPATSGVCRVSCPASTHCATLDGPCVPN
jgi:Type IV secretion system pilin